MTNPTAVLDAQDLVVTQETCEDARMALLLIKSGEWFSRKELEEWILDRFFRPLEENDFEDDMMRIVEITTDRRLSWMQQNHYRPSDGRTNMRAASHPTVFTSLSSTTTHTPPLSTGADADPANQQSLLSTSVDPNAVISRKRIRMMQYTRIFTIAQSYRMVFMLDMSASMATIDPISEQVLVKELLETFCNMLLGVVAPFKIPERAGEHPDFEINPKLYLTVIAAYNHPAASLNEQSTFSNNVLMRPLVQGVVVVQANVHDVLEKVEREIYNMQENIASKSQRLAGLAYSDTYLRSHPDPSTHPPLQDEVKKSKDTKTQKSGVAEVLRAGQFALSLLPSEALSSLILFTDGVINSNAGYPGTTKGTDNILRKLTADGVACTVVQLGSMLGFSPSCNFGFVPDNEALRHIAVATCGTFLYASDCKPAKEISHHSIPSLSPLAKETTECLRAGKPNFYHRQLLLREIHVSATSSDNRYSAVNGGRERPVDLARERVLEVPRHRTVSESRNMKVLEDFGSTYFPWDSTSHPPSVDSVIMRYRDYTLDVDMRHLIATRLREGFTVHSIYYGGGRSNKRDKFYIYLSLLYLPNVTIQYRIKGLWTPGSVPSQLPLHLKAPRVELNIQAFTGFAMYFVNLEKALKQNKHHGHPLYEKAHKLRSYLEDIYATDELLKSVAQFAPATMIPPSTLPAPQTFKEKHRKVSVSLSTPSNIMESFADYFQQLFRNKVWSLTSGWFDVRYVDVIVRPMYVESRGSNDCMTPSAIIDRLHQELSQKWSTFPVMKGSETGYVQVVRIPALEVQQTSLCLLQIKHLTNRFLVVKLSYFNMSISERKRALHELKNTLSEITEPVGSLPSLADSMNVDDANSDISSRNGSNNGTDHILPPAPRSLHNLLVVCKRPLRQLLIDDHLPSNLPSPVEVKKNVRHTEGIFYPPSLVISDRPISYLRRQRAVWLSDVDPALINQDKREAKASVGELAYRLVYNARLKEGYLIIRESDIAVVFYNEILPRPNEGVSNEISDNRNSSDNSHIFAIQYVLSRTRGSTTITTQLAVEPVQDIQMKDKFHSVQRHLEEVDTMICAQVTTFDIIWHYLRQSYRESVRLPSVSNSMNSSELIKGTRTKASLGEQRPTKYMPTFVGATALIPGSKFIVSLCELPRWDVAHLCNVHKGQIPNPLLPFDVSFITPRLSVFHPSPILHTSKELFRLLIKYATFVPISCVEANYTISRYFLEKALSEISDGEIVASDSSFSSPALYNALHLAVKKRLEVECPQIPSMNLGENLSDCRWFVKQQKESVLLLMIPSLKADLESGLASNYAYGQPSQSGTPSQILKPYEWSSLMIFECSRNELENRCQNSTGLTTPGEAEPSLEETELDSSNPLRSTNQSHMTASIDPIDNFWSCPTNVDSRPSSSFSSWTAQKIHTECYMGSFRPSSSGYTDVLKFSTAWSPNITSIFHQVYVKSVYSSLLQQHAVSKDSFRRALTACVETSIEVDITAFLNTRLLESVKKHPVAQAEDEELHLRLQTLLKELFRPVMYAGEENDDGLYYYRPAARKKSKLIVPSGTQKGRAVGRHLNDEQVPAPKKMGYQEKGNLSKNETASPIGEDGQKDAEREAVQEDGKSRESGEQPGEFFQSETTTKQQHEKPEVDDRSPASVFRDVLTHGNDPLFIRFECTFKKSDTSFVNFPVTRLPLDYTCSVHGRPHDYAPSKIGTRASPVESVDGTKATLHIICLSLTSIHPLQRDANWRPMSFENFETAEKDKSSMQEETEQMDSDEPVPVTHEEAVAEIEARIEWLLKEEVLYGLLKVQPVTKAVLRHVESQLSSTNYFNPIPSSSIVPLSLVRRKYGRDMFLEELGKVDLRPFTMNRLGQYFYVSGDLTVQTEDSTSSHTGPGTQGIGDELTPGDNVSERRIESAKGVSKFWLLLIPQKLNMQALFFANRSPKSARNGIIDHVIAAIKSVSQRVSRLVLLKELNERRICSNYLVLDTENNDGYDVPSESSDEDSGSQMYDETPNLQQPSSARSRFLPGQFSCPLVFRRSFPLHWRLKPNQALNGIATMVMHPFSVSNRRNLFVIAKNKSVFYMKLLEIGTNAASATDVDTADDVGRQGNDANIVSDECNGESTPPSATGSAPNSAKIPTTPGATGHGDISRTPVFSRRVSALLLSKMPELRELVLEVYGVDPPGREITEELVALLENKLTTNITLSVISTFVARNVTLKLTPADLAYVLPIDRKPTRTMRCSLPKEVGELLNFIMYFKQNMLQFLNPLGGQDAIAILKEYYGVSEGSSSKSESDSELREIAVGELSFLYNSIPTRTPTTAEAAIGQGMASVCVAVLNKGGQPMFELPALTPYYRSFDSIRDIASRFSHSWIVPGREGEADQANFVELSELSINVEIWTVGSVNADALVDKVWDALRASLCDYFLEIAVLPELWMEAKDEEALCDIDEMKTLEERTEGITQKLDSVFDILQQGAEWNNPSVSGFSIQLNMDPQTVNEAVSGITQILRNSHEHFKPLVFRASSPDPLSFDRVEATWERRFPSTFDSPAESALDLPELSTFVIAGGMREVQGNNNLVAPVMTSPLPTLAERRSSLDSEHTHSRRSSVDTYSSERSNVHSHSRKSSYNTGTFLKNASSLDDIVLYSRTIPESSGPKRDVSRNCFFLLQMDGFALHMYAYNWRPTFYDHISWSIQRVISWHASRRNLLNNVLCQKMGLYHHSPPFASILAEAYPPPVPRPTSANTQNVPLLLHNLNPLNPSNLHSLMYNQQTPARILGITDEMAKRSEMGQNPESGCEQENIPEGWTKTPFSRIDSALKDACPKVAKSSIRYTSHHDALIQHGSQLMETFLYHATLAQTQENALAIYTKWSKRHHNGTADDHAISASDLAIVLRSSRLLHFCRTPLLFTEFRGSLISRRSNNAKRETPVYYQGEDVRGWYAMLADTFMRQYVKYLQTLGMKLIASGANTLQNENQPSPAITSNFTVSETLAVDVPVVFMQKAFLGGLLMSEVRIQGMFACVNLYTINRRYGRLHVASPGFSSAEADRQSFKLFTEESEKFKNMIHINSFVYDFHIRYFLTILEQMPNTPPMLDLLDTINTFIAYNTKPANFARNRIYQGAFHVDTKQLPNNLFQYIMQNPPRYGLRTVICHNAPVGCYVTSNFPDFSQTEDDTESGTLRYTLIVYLAESTPRELRLNYFVLVSNQRELYPRPPMNRQEGVLPDSSDAINPLPHMAEDDKDDPLSEHITAINTLADIVSYAEIRLDSMIQQAVRYFGRDTLWNGLRSKTFRPSDEDFAMLSTRFNGRPLADFDASLTQLFQLRISWSGALDFLAKNYKTHTRSVQTEGGTRYLVIFNPNEEDSLIEFVYNGGPEISAYFLTKEGRGKYNAEEVQHVNDVIRSILYHVWRLI